MKTKNLLNMAICGCAGTFGLGIVYPMETIKTMIQLKNQSTQKMTIRSVFKERVQVEGFRSLYRGLAAGSIRQFIGAAIRLGLYFNFSDYLKAKHNKPTLTVMESTMGALATGAIAMTVIMPLDIVYVRYQAENVLPKEQRRGYTSVFNALSRIVKEEGVAQLWRGLNPTVARGMAAGIGMMVPYEKCKAFLARYLGYTYLNYMISSMIAGVGVTCCGLPFDNVKVRLQAMKMNPDGSFPYRGVLDCFFKCVKTEGLLSLWKGFLPCILFVGSLSSAVLLISDSLRILLGVTKH